jgi:hypothetical protein
MSSQLNQGSELDSQEHAPRCARLLLLRQAVTRGARDPSAAPAWKVASRRTDFRNQKRNQPALVAGLLQYVRRPEISGRSSALDHGLYAPCEVPLERSRHPCRINVRLLLGEPGSVGSR